MTRASEEAKGGMIDLNGRVEIASENGLVLDVVTFSQAVKLRLEGAAA